MIERDGFGSGSNDGGDGYGDKYFEGYGHGWCGCGAGFGEWAGNGYGYGNDGHATGDGKCNPALNDSIFTILKDEEKP